MKRLVGQHHPATFVARRIRIELFVPGGEPAPHRGLLLYG